MLCSIYFLLLTTILSIRILNFLSLAAHNSKIHEGLEDEKLEPVPNVGPDTVAD